MSFKHTISMFIAVGIFVVGTSSLQAQTNQGSGTGGPDPNTPFKSPVPAEGSRKKPDFQQGENPREATAPPKTRGEASQELKRDEAPSRQSGR